MSDKCARRMIYVCRASERAAAFGAESELAKWRVPNTLAVDQSNSLAGRQSARAAEIREPRRPIIKLTRFAFHFSSSSSRRDLVSN